MDWVHMKVVGPDKLEKGDVLLIFRDDGSMSLAMCTAGLLAYDHQGGEGAKLIHETGRQTAFEYGATRPSNICVIGNVGGLDTYPLRQLLNWRGAFEY